MKPYLFKFDSDTSEKLDRIAVYLSEKTGMRVNRTDALRHLVNTFFIPSMAIDSQKAKNSQPAEQAA